MSEQRWFESDAFWRDLACKIYGLDQAVAAPDEAADAMRLLQCPATARVLDLCCGNGRHAIALAASGYEVTGVDLSAIYLSVAAASAAAAGVEVEWIREDIRCLRHPQVFDAAMILWNAFGYFEDDAQDLAALRAAAACLRPGGRLLIQTHGRESTARKFVRKDWFEIGDTIVLDQRWIEADWSRMRTRYVVIAPEGRREHTMSCRLYSPTQLKQLLEVAGFTDVIFAGGLDGRPYDEKAIELVALANRAG